MRIISYVCIILMGWVTLAQAKSKLHPRQNRRFHRGIIKRVTLTFPGKHIIFSWRTPSGKMIHYAEKQLSSGLRARLLRYKKAGKTTLAVGGEYEFLQGNKGVVKPEFAYAIKRTWRGLRVVKFDGVMPLFTVTVLPFKTGSPAATYEFRGIVHSKLSVRDNKLICVYGTWFDLLDAPRGMLSQTYGIKGRSLLFFPKKFRTPRSWRSLLDPKAKWRAFQAEKQRKLKNLPPLKQALLIPTFSLEQYKHYYGICLQRLSAFEKKKNASPPAYKQAQPKRKQPQIQKKPVPRSKG